MPIMLRIICTTSVIVAPANTARPRPGQRYGSDLVGGRDCSRLGRISMIARTTRRGRGHLVRLLERTPGP